MARTRKPSPFGPSREPAGQGASRSGKATGAAKPRQRQQVIPDAVAGRMARRVAVGETGGYAPITPTASALAVEAVLERSEATPR